MMSAGVQGRTQPGSRPRRTTPSSSSCTASSTASSGGVLAGPWKTRCALH